MGVNIGLFEIYEGLEVIHKNNNPIPHTSDNKKVYYFHFIFANSQSLAARLLLLRVEIRELDFGRMLRYATLTADSWSVCEVLY